MDRKEPIDRQYHHVRVATTVRKASDFDPQKSFPFVVRNQSSDKLVYVGYLKALDPISKSAILCQIENSEITKNIIILGHCIEEINLSEENDLIPPCDVRRIVELEQSQKFTNHSSHSLTDQEVKDRRDEIVGWLRKLRIPANVDAITNEVIVADSVRIRPPYESATNYICPTRIVLSRIKRIVESRGEMIK